MIGIDDDDDHNDSHIIFWLTIIVSLSRPAFVKVSVIVVSGSLIFCIGYQSSSLKTAQPYTPRA